MKYSIYVFMVSLSVALMGSAAFGESTLIAPLAASKSTGDSGTPAAAGSHKEVPSTAHEIERLSNAVSQDYIIGAEDILEITVWRNKDLSNIVQVRPDGRISMPIIRDIVAVGKTPLQVAEEITSKLKEFVQNPVVAVSVKEVHSSNIFVLGEVARPGRYPLLSKTTLLQGVTIAGGFNLTAARNQIVIFRFTESAPGMKRLTASYDDIVLRGDIQDNFELKSGDTVVVPSEAMVVFPGK